MEQPRGRGHGQQRRHAHGAGGLAEDRDLVGVTAERGDVVAHPLERGDLVEQPAVARAGELRIEVAEVEEAERAEAVVEGDEHDAVAGRTTCRRSSGDEPEPISNPPPWIHTMTGRDPVERRGPDVQVEAVLVPLLGVTAEERVHDRRVLRCDRAERVGGTDVVPGLDRLRWPEAQLADRRCGERDAGEAGDPAVPGAAQRAVGGRRVDLGSVGRGSHGTWCSTGRGTRARSP